MRIAFAQSAIHDLEAIRDNLIELDAPGAAHDAIIGVIGAVDRLRVFPDSGRVVPEFGVEQLREIVLPPYRIVYRRDDDAVRILRVWRSERLLELP